MSSIMEFIRYFSYQEDVLFDLGNLKYCKEYPKFVVDYIKNVQPNLEYGRELCALCFPVAPMETEEGSDENKESYFWTSAEDGLDLGLIYKSGKWYEKKGLFFKKLIPVSDPAQWIVDYISGGVDLEDPDNKRNPDYPKFVKALESLKKMIGKYRS